MVSRDNPYDMQIKLIMIGDVGIRILVFFYSVLIIVLVQVLGKRTFCFDTPTTPFPQRLSQQLALTLKLKISIWMESA
jgi:hypothetical protein